MPTYQGRLLSCLILSALSVHTWADSVLVNTTADKSLNDEFCSLRESISYLNLKNSKKKSIDAEIVVLDTALTKLKYDLSLKQLELTQEQNKATSEQKPALIASLIKEIDDPETGFKKQISVKEAAITAKQKELADYRSAGVNGCKSETNEGTDTVKFQKSTTPYELNSVVTVNTTIIFTTESSIDTTNTELSNLDKVGAGIEPRTIIKAIGNHGLFLIDDGLNNDIDSNPDTALTYISATFNNIDFQGCGTNFCEVNGGIFTNKEELVINDSIMSGGFANNFGGAIYNATNAVFAGNQILFQNNQANDNGAAIYSEQASIYISNDLFTKNTSPNAIVAVANKAALVRGTSLPVIINSTFSGNSGTAISSRESLSLKNLTIVLNTNGINFNDQTPILYSSIVAANVAQDCLNLGVIPDAKTTYIAHNIYQKGCGLPPVSAEIAANNPNNKQLTTEKIIADTDANGKCAAPPADGLLCPLADNGGLTKTHKPRLLISYATLADSPIVNKGITSSVKFLACPEFDQRALKRTNCDIGAVELQGLVATTQGQDITYGQKAAFDLNEKIGDGELLPANQCSALFGPLASGYRDGCVRVLNAPTKGVVEFDNINHQVLYHTTLPDFHGFDKFSYVMTTTISRFSDARNDQEVKVDVKVISDPAGSLPDKSLDTGATSILSLFMLSLLMVWRRTR